MDYVTIAAQFLLTVVNRFGSEVAKSSPHLFNLIRVRSQPIGRAQTLLSVDAGPSHEGSLSIAPGVRFRCAAPGVAASTSNPWARPRPLETKTIRRNRRQYFLGNHRRSAYGKFRKVRSALDWGADCKFLGPPDSPPDLRAADYR